MTPRGAQTQVLRLSSVGQLATLHLCPSFGVVGLCSQLLQSGSLGMLLGIAENILVAVVNHCSCVGETQQLGVLMASRLCHCHSSVHKHLFFLLWGSWLRISRRLEFPVWKVRCFFCYANEAASGKHLRSRILSWTLRTISSLGKETG